MTTSMFSKYDSIDNHYDRVQISRFEEIVPPKEPCFFKEKVHGANLQICIDQRGNIEPMKRSGLIKPNENFYYTHPLISNLTPQLKEVYQSVRKLPQYDDKLTSRISICGEICGGAYPDIKGDGRSKCVQKGVWYAPYNLFYAFDIRFLIDQSEIELDKREPQPFMPWSECIKVLDTGNIFRAETLHTMCAREVTQAFKLYGKIADIPAKFQTTLPDRLGLENVDDNFAEGYVITPDNSYFRGSKRMIFKYKNDDFAEKKPNIKTAKNIDHQFEQLWLDVEEEFLDSVVLKNRLNNVLSHQGLELTDIKVRGTILHALTNDLLEDIEKNEDQRLSENYQKQLSKKLISYCSKFIQKCVTQSI